MTPFSMFLALQPVLQHEWGLSNTESGWISSAYYAGYMLAVPVLASLTDRVDARAVWLAAAATAVAGAFAFATLAHGMWTAAAAQIVAGGGLAGTYMPGLKVMADRMRPAPRHVAFYTTSFTAGAALSFWTIGRLAAHAPWQAAVLAAAGGPFVGCLLVVALGRVRVATASEISTASHWRAVFGSPDTIRFVAGYAAHTWELFAVRAWLVPFLSFVASARGGAGTLRATTLAAAVSLIGIPASILGAELTSRIGRRRVVVGTMLAAIACSLLVVPAALAGWPALVAMTFLYSCFISGDSAALTSGILAVAPIASRGTAMAVYSTVGFAAASAGTFAVGVLLDMLGGQSFPGWAFAFAIMSVANVVGAIAIGRSKTV